MWGGGKEYNDPQLSKWIPPRPWAAEVGLVLVKEALYKMGVPVAYMQLDDWWYQGPFYFGNVKSVVDWHASSSKGLFPNGTRREPFNYTPMGVNPISSGSPHVRPMGVHRTCGEPNDEIKKNTHPKNTTALFRDKVPPQGNLAVRVWFPAQRRLCADSRVARP